MVVAKPRAEVKEASLGQVMHFQTVLKEYQARFGPWTDHGLGAAGSEGASLEYLCILSYRYGRYGNKSKP